MKTACLVETAPKGLDAVKSYLSDMNAGVEAFASVDQAVRSGIRADLVVLLADRNPETYRADILRMRTDPEFSKIPRISILPFHFTMHRTASGIMEGEQEFFMPVDKLAFLSAAAQALKIPQRRKFRIVISIQPAEGSLKYSGISVDFSESGMSFETTTDFNPDQLLIISFVNPRIRTRLSLKASVVRRALTQSATSTFYGVRFVGLTEEDSSALKDFISGKAD